MHRHARQLEKDARSLYLNLVAQRHGQDKTRLDETSFLCGMLKKVEIKDQG